MYLASSSFCKACADCLSLLFAPDQQEKSYPHLSIEGIRQAASEGCHLCACINLQWMNPQGCCRNPHTTYEFMISANKSSQIVEIKHVCWRNVWWSSRFYVTKVKACDVFLYPDANQFGHSTRSARCQTLARGWIEACAASHDHCAAQVARLSTLESSKLPTRLLDLHEARLTRSIRLVTTETERIQGPYVTLSHCWGANPLIRLTQSNLQTFCENIEIDALPQTFRDAIEVCEWLNFRYIWIDSLCIIQDSKADWEKESVTMKNTYSNGILNIAASTATDSTFGLFRERKHQRHVSPLWEDPKYGTHALHIPMDRLSHSISIGPLANRGWVLQEWLLSPRILHFGDQLFWECPEMISCENYPRGSPDRNIIPEPEYFMFKRSISSSISASDKELGTVGSNTELHRAWRDICRDYASRDLTVDSDKIVALSGVTEVFQSLVKDTLMCGIWKSTLIPDLCWLSSARKWVMDPGNVARWKFSTMPSRPSEYGVPSWSWLSVSNQIRWDLSVELSRKDPSDGMLSPIVISELACLTSDYDLECREGSSIKLHGMLRHAKWKLTGQDAHNIDQYQIYLDGFRAFDSMWTYDRFAKPASATFANPAGATITPDDQLGGSFTTEDIFLLPLIASYNGAPLVTGIILSKAGKVQFRRVGHFTVNTFGVYGSLFFELLPPASILKDPWKYFREYAKKNKTAEEIKLYEELLKESPRDAPIGNQPQERQVWQVQDIQRALGPYNKSMFNPLKAREIQII